MTRFSLSKEVAAGLLSLSLSPAVLTPRAIASVAAPLPCFTPGQDCLAVLLTLLDQTQTSLRIHAYEFTSVPLSQSVCQAHQRGVKVTILMDRSQLTQKWSQLATFQAAGIPVYIDPVPGIAHNKIMILDDKTVVTGSYNWTEAAEKRNAENVVQIQDPTCVQAYVENWHLRQQTAVEARLFQRQAPSAAFNPFLCMED